MPGFTDTLAADQQRWSWIARIEGVGPWVSTADLGSVSNDGRTRFCDQLPDYYTQATGGALALWRADLRIRPDFLPERPELLGGTSGQVDEADVTLEIVDVDDYLTSLVRVDSIPQTALAEDVDISETAIDVLSAAGITTTSVVFIGSEAMRVTGIASNTLTVVRGYLSTDAVSHQLGDSVFRHLQNLHGRRLQVTLVPKDAADATEEYTEITAKIVHWGWDALLNTWVFSAKTQERHLHRMAPLEPKKIPVQKSLAEHYETLGLEYDSSAKNVLFVERGASPGIESWEIWPSTPIHAACDGEVVSIEPLAGDAIMTVLLAARGLAGTIPVDISAGDFLSQVMLGESRYGAGDFRFSPGPSPSTSRSSGTWTQTMHWCDYCRIIMVSQAADDADLSITNNYVASNGNFASLPSGYGLGLPVAQIDWPSWEAVKARTLECVFPYFVYGDEPVPFLDLITEAFLRPIGAYIVYRSGLAKIVLPRAPLQGDSTITLGVVNLLKRAVAPKLYQPRINAARMDISQHGGTLIYFLGPQKFPVTLRSGKFQSVYGQRGYYGADDRPVEIPVRFADPLHESVWVQRGVARLFRRHKPRFDLDADFDLGENYDKADVGDVASLTLSEVPNLETGVRGVTSLQCEIAEREPTAGAANEGPYVRMRLLAYGALKAGKICPSARIASVAVNTATVDANRFTEPDASGLPISDAAAFAPGDVCRLAQRNGLSGGGTTQIVQSTGVNTITFDGNFGGSMATDDIVVYAVEEEAAVQQTSAYAFMSDKTRLGVDADRPWQYGEP